MAKLDVKSDARLDAFLGTWELDVSKNNYQTANAPSQGSYTISLAGKNTLQFDMNWVDANGDAQSAQYSSIVDGEKHPYPNPEVAAFVQTGLLATADATAPELAETAVMETLSLNQDGQVIARGTRKLADDGKTMLVSQEGFLPGGEAFVNHSVYTKQLVTAKYLVRELKDPPFPTPEFDEMYRNFAKRILWMDGNVVDGAFQMNTAWYFAVPEKNPPFEEHTHEADEIIGFIGSDPDDPYNLHGELEVYIEGEKHVLTTSTMLFLPGGVKHMPLVFKRVDKPIFHFSVVTSRIYDKGAYK